MPQPTHDLAEIVGTTAMVHGAYVAFDCQTGTGTATRAVDFASGERVVLMVCANDQVKRQALSRLESTAVDRKGRVEVMTIRDPKLKDIDPSGYDIVFFDELYDEQRRAAAGIARRFADALKTVVERRNDWQRLLLDRSAIVLGPAGGKPGKMVVSREIERDDVDPVGMLVDAHAVGREPVSEHEGLALAARNTVVSARLLVNFGHWNAAVSHLISAVSLASRASQGAEATDEEDGVIAALLDARMAIEERPWVAMGASEVEGWLSVVDAFVERSVSPEAVDAPRF